MTHASLHCCKDVQFASVAVLRCARLGLPPWRSAHGPCGALFGLYVCYRLKYSMGAPAGAAVLLFTAGGQDRGCRCRAALSVFY